MKTHNLIFAMCVGFLLSCNGKQEFKAIDKIDQKDSLVPLQRTVIADLPDSLQPKSFRLEDMPKPEVRTVPESGGEIMMLPVMVNEKGEPILDDKGNTILMGHGGLSNFTTFTTDDGLALDVVFCSILDQFGNLWFGTNGGGVNRYDGKSFTNFTTAHGIASNNIRSITEDKNGNIWFGTEGKGVNRYDGISISNFTTEQGLANNSVFRIKEDKTGNLWFGTDGGGVSRFDGHSFTNFSTADGLASNVVWSIFEDNVGYMWFGTGNGGISRLNLSELQWSDSASQDIKQYNITNYTVAQGLPYNRVTSITEDKTGNLWFGTLGVGASRYDRKSFTNFSTANGLTNNFVINIVEDKSRNIWFCTSGGGVSKFNGKSFTNFTAAQGLANNDVWNMVEDKSGSLWFGTVGGGISRLEDKSFTSFTNSHGLANNSISFIAEDREGNLWVSPANGGVSKYDGKSFTNFNTTHGLSNFNVWSIKEDVSGNLWFGIYEGGFCKFDGKLFTNYTTAQGLPDNVGQSIAEDKYGNLWFGTFSGVTKFDGKSFTNFSTLQGLPSNNIQCIIEDKMGNLWFGTYDGGVVLFDGKSFITFTTVHGMADNSVNSIKEDKFGNLWFGTEKGLSILTFEHYKDLLQKNTNVKSFNSPPNDKTTHPHKATDKIALQNSTSSTLFRSFGMESGLPDNTVKQIIQMPNAKMAVGTKKGITLFNISEDFNRLTDLEIFHSSTGYPVKDVENMLLDSKGILWAGTGADKTGLVRFDYEALNQSVEAPVLFIQSIKVKDENISWHTLREALGRDGGRDSKLINKNSNPQDSITTPSYITEEVSLFGRELRLAERDSMKQRFGNIEFDGIRPFYPLPENLVLPYNLNQVSFEFVAIETTRPQMVKYQFLLEGYDKDWGPVTSRSNATYGNIHEGTYTFKLKAQGANGIWTEPVIYTFRVLPPWYRTWWAYGIYFLSLVGLVWRIHLIQKARTIRLEREKTKDKELAQAKEIERAYSELGRAHETLKSTQAQLIHSEKMASLGELTAGIAHEIQNPLNFVNNFSELNQELICELDEALENGNTHEAKEVAKDLKDNEQKINHHGKRADAIVKGMLQHSRVSAGEKVPTDINALADEYLRLSYHGMRAKDKSFNVEFRTDFDPNLPRINVVPQDIGRVLLNVINNAFQACSQRDLLSPDSYLGKNPTGLIPTVTVSTKNLIDKIEISIADNGTGIPDSIKDKIFQPFFTTKPSGQGTGLGLSLSYDIVKAHGGEIKINSKEGEGSVFLIFLPYI